MKKQYTKPYLKLKGFYVSEKIAAPVPPPDLSGMGLDPIVSNSITSYVVGSGVEASPSPSPNPPG